MKLRLTLPLLAFFITSPVLVTAADEPSAAPETAQRTLTITVVEPVDRKIDSSEYFNRLARVFPEVFAARQWPVKIDVQRFGGNAPEHALELRVFLQKLREETSGDLTFRAWMTLYDRGTKHDLGVITHRYYYRAGQQMDDLLDAVLRGAASEVAPKIEGVLFPDLNSGK